MINKDAIDAESASQLFRKKGFPNTAKWVEFAIHSKMMDLSLNLGDAIESLRLEITSYEREYYSNPSFNRDCFDSILDIVLGGMIVGRNGRFYKLTEDLMPFAKRNLETTRTVEEVVKLAENLKGRNRFYVLCFCYLILFEGHFKSLVAQLLAMKRLKEGKNVTIGDALKVITDKRIERSFDIVTPSDLRKGIHRHLRNSIAHAYFTYSEKKDKMKFWDIDANKNEYSMKPIEHDYKSFSRYVAEIQIFCDTFGFLISLIAVFEDIARARKATHLRFVYKKI